MSTPPRVWPSVPAPFWRRQLDVAPETPSESKPSTSTLPLTWTSFW